MFDIDQGDDISHTFSTDTINTEYSTEPAGRTECWRAKDLDRVIDLVSSASTARSAPAPTYYHIR